jgi:hypothetical protein
MLPGSVSGVGAQSLISSTFSYSFPSEVGNGGGEGKNGPLTASETRINVPNKKSIKMYYTINKGHKRVCTVIPWYSTLHKEKIS